MFSFIMQEYEDRLWLSNHGRIYLQRPLPVFQTPLEESEAESLQYYRDNPLFISEQPDEEENLASFFAEHIFVPSRHNLLYTSYKAYVPNSLKIALFSYGIQKARQYLSGTGDLPTLLSNSRRRNRHFRQRVEPDRIIRYSPFERLTFRQRIHRT